MNNMDFSSYATSTYASTTGFSPDMMMQYATSSILQTFYGTIFSTFNHFTLPVIAGLMIFAIIFFGYNILVMFDLL